MSKNLGGRPTIYTDALADEICDTIANSPRGLNYWCRKFDHWPNRSTIIDWCKKNEAFSNLYSKAKQSQADFMADEMIDVAYDDKKDHKIIIDDKGNEKVIVCNEAVNRSRLKVDTLKHITAVLKPRLYGCKVEKSPDSETKDLMSRLIDKL